MKTIPPPCPEPEVGPKYWRSLDELADKPEFREWASREFPAGASELADPVTRRYFMKIMSASFLLAGFGLTGCRRPEHHIVPFGQMPENYIHGVPLNYATAMPQRTAAIPLVVRSHDGRPIKIEGNGQHPASNGGTDRYAQASILNLYDPDRSTRFTYNGAATTREAAFDALLRSSKQYEANGGQGLSILLEASSSPSRLRLQQQIAQKLPQARWYIHEPVDFDVDRKIASQLFGQSVRPMYRFDRAKVILSLDGDFIGAEENAYIYINGFANGRKISSPNGTMNRLYVVEDLMTLTGVNADHRLRIPTSQVPAVAAKLAAEVLRQTGQQAGALGNLESVGATAQVDEKWIVECAKDLAANAGACLVVTGHRQPAATHALVHAMNSALGNIGQTVELHAAPESREGTLADLTQALTAGQVQTLVIIGANPVYSAPSDLNFGGAVSQSKAVVVRLGYYEDETFPVSSWHLPMAHYLESWGDARTADGTYVPVQPLIEPLFAGVTELEVLARLGGFSEPSPYATVRETFRQLAGDSDEAWKRFLHDGFLPNSAAQPVQARFNPGAASQLISGMNPIPAPSKTSLELVFHRDYSVDDGRFANNGWLQELPDPVTKMTWENVLLMSPKTAEDLGLAIKDFEDNRLMVPWVKVQAGGREIEGPAWVQPGQADYTIGLALGYGRERTGRVGTGSGYNAYKLRTAASPWILTGGTLASTGRRHQLATTQNHWAMEGRPIIREANLEQYRKHPKFAHAMDLEEPPVSAPMYQNPLERVEPSSLHQWGMSIDLNACVGCSTCVVACQSENNVPIVGKDQVTKNREMHWLRIDRYYTGPIANPQVVTQPMLCQHCEKAPCENVCPVNATVHDHEGLNLMVYNRCVGTRYCSNNCPYKIRRFNFFDYNKRPLNELYKSPVTSVTDGEWELKRWAENPDRPSRDQDEWTLRSLQHNPDVTVRMRGVMEKCTYCVQRIESAKIAQKVKAKASPDVVVPDGMVKTACQQACPAGAIVFGNIKDPNSEVSKLKQQNRTYRVLEFLATNPRTTYLARVRNPNPAMPDYYASPYSVDEVFPDAHGDPFAGHGAGHGTEGANGHSDHETPGEPGRH